jgi:tetratricopeptide (TPR) repeat protein
VKKPRRPAKGDAVAALLREAVRLHQAGQFERAQALYARILKLSPDQPDALHLSGLLRYQAGDLVNAETLIRRALRLNPRAASYYNSLGVVALAQSRADEARAHFTAALDRDPAYAQALNNLGNALQILGRLSEAVAAYRQALALNATDGETHANLGRALQALNRPAEAAQAFRHALALRPASAAAKRGLADALAGTAARAEAEALYREAIALAPDDPQSRAALAAFLERTGRLEEALAAAGEALARDAGNVRAAVAQARALRRLGREEEALARLDGLDLANAEAEARSYATFEKAMLCDRLGAYGRAITLFGQANALMLATPAAAGIDRDAYPRLIARLKARFTADWVQGWTPSVPATEAPPAPIFLIGFPRSGTTLLDQILDSHSGLTTMEEKDALDVVRARIDRLPGGYPDALAGLDAAALRDLRDQYFARVAHHLGGPPAGILVDKMPLNTIDAGLIWRLFPDARILLALRHPCDVVLSGFMQPFQLNQTMIHFTTLAGTARFYADVMGLWQRYAEVLPLSIITVRYEDLVADVAAESRRIVAGLGLAWDDAVLSYAEHAKAKAIATPSYHQVVQPIYRRSAGRWLNYREAFADVKPILEPFIEAWGYDAEA